MATQNADRDTEGGLPPAVVEDLLSDDIRHRAVSILAARDEPVVVQDLAAAIVAAQADCSQSAVSAADRDAMVKELFTEHVPKLMATDVLNYDSMLGAVELQRREIVPQEPA